MALALTDYSTPPFQHTRADASPMLNSLNFGETRNELGTAQSLTHFCISDVTLLTLDKYAHFARCSYRQGIYDSVEHIERVAGRNGERHLRRTGAACSSCRSWSR
jgi:hypothetical protein